MCVRVVLLLPCVTDRVRVLVFFVVRMMMMRVCKCSRVPVALVRVSPIFMDVVSMRLDCANTRLEHALHNRLVLSLPQR